MEQWTLISSLWRSNDLKSELHLLKNIVRKCLRFEGAIFMSELVSHSFPLLKTPPGLHDPGLQLVDLIVKHCGGDDLHRGPVSPEDDQI